MKGKLLVIAMLSAGLVPGMANAQDAITSELNASLRLGLGLTTEPEAELTFNNYGSRIGWQGTADAGENLKALSRVEFGFDQEGGVRTTRYAYVGVEGGFGTVTGGKQYAAFYDAVSSAVDIAYFGSCIGEISCGRQSSVIKYASKQKNDLQFMASTTLIDGDQGNDFIDGIDLGAVLTSGDMKLGAGISLDMGNPASGTDFADRDAGIGLGFSATLPIDEATLSGTFQFANDDFVGGQDNGILLTAAYQRDQVYGVLGFSKADNSGFYLTLGYEKPLINDRAFAYFEVGVLDSGVDGVDTDFGARAVMVYNLDILSTGK